MKSDIHFEKYERFRESAEQERYIPSRIEDYFKAAFHLIESVAYKKMGVHIGMPNKVAIVLSSNPEIFGSSTEKIVEEFLRLEINTFSAEKTTEGFEEILEDTKETFKKIERICRGILKAD